MFQTTSICYNDKIPSTTNSIELLLISAQSIFIPFSYQFIMEYLPVVLNFEWWVVILSKPLNKMYVRQFTEKNHFEGNRSTPYLRRELMAIECIFVEWCTKAFCYVMWHMFSAGYSCGFQITIWYSWHLTTYIIWLAAARQVFKCQLFWNRLQVLRIKQESYVIIKLLIKVMLDR